MKHLTQFWGWLCTTLGLLENDVRTTWGSQGWHRTTMEYLRTTWGRFEDDIELNEVWSKGTAPYWLEDKKGKFGKIIKTNQELLEVIRAFKRGTYIPVLSQGAQELLVVKVKMSRFYVHHFP